MDLEFKIGRDFCVVMNEWVITEEYNVMVNCGELIGTIEHLTL
jgi:hypothetical protein